MASDSAPTAQPDQMRAAVRYSYCSPGDVQVKDIPKPTPDKDNVLIKVSAASLNGGDWRVVSADPPIIRFAGFGILKPSSPQLGTDVAGEVVQVGKDVTKLKVGDKVFGFGKGTFAEYAIGAESQFCLLPSGMDFTSASAIPVAATTALNAVRDWAKVEKDNKVCVIGASGGVGGFIVQLAKHYGAEVTAVCSAAGAEIARQYGADHVIDYNSEQWLNLGVNKKEQSDADQPKFDYILDCAGYDKVSKILNIMSDQKEAKYIIISGKISRTLGGIMKGKYRGKKVEMNVAQENPEDLVVLQELASQGVLKPIVTKTYKLAQISEAMKLISEGHAKGKMVIEIP